MKAKSEMKKEHKLWEKASITDLKKSEKVMIVCPHCDKEFDVSQFEKLTYEQGKKDERERQNPRLDNMYKQAKQVGFSQARKQTLEEVLKMADKFNIFEESDTGAIKFIEWLEQELKGASK